MRKHPERDIESACTELLALDGWRCIKTDLPHLRGLGVQEKGMADRLYLRYNATFDDLAEVWWIEFKTIRGKLSPEQIAWHEAERARGAMTWKAKIDFHPTVEGFLEKYAASGLMRRKLTMKGIA